MVQRGKIMNEAMIWLWYQTNSSYLCYARVAMNYITNIFIDSQKFIVSKRIKSCTSLSLGICSLVI